MQQLTMTMPVPAVAEPSNSTSVAAYQPDGETAAVVDACRGAIAWRPDDGTPAESYRLPTPAERALLEHRRARLAVMSRGCGATDTEKKRAARAVALMLAGFLRTRNLDESAKQRMVAGMVADLLALPAWAVERACERFRRGEVDGQNLSFAPTSAEVYQQGLREMATLRVEERAITATLQLQPCRHVSPEARARAAEKAMAWLDRSDPRARDLEAAAKARDVNLAAARAVAERDAAAQAAEWRRRGVDAPRIGGCPISPELAAQLRLEPHRPEADVNFE